MKKKGIVITIVCILLVILICVLCYLNLSKKYSITIKNPKQVITEIKDKISGKEKSEKSSSGSADNNSNGSTKNSNGKSNSQSNNGKSNSEEEQQMSKSKDVNISLKMSEAVIGTKVQIVIGDEIKSQYKDIDSYEVFDGDKQISPQAKIDKPTLMMANKKENDIVKVKLFDSNSKVLAKLNAKLVK